MLGNKFKNTNKKSCYLLAASIYLGILDKSLSFHLMRYTYYLRRQTRGLRMVRVIVLVISLFYYYCRDIFLTLIGQSSNSLMQSRQKERRRRRQPNKKNHLCHDIATARVRTSQGGHPQPTFRQLNILEINHWFLKATDPANRCLFE